MFWRNLREMRCAWAMSSAVEVSFPALAISMQPRSAYSARADIFMTDMRTSQPRRGGVRRRGSLGPWVWCSRRRRSCPDLLQLAGDARGQGAHVDGVPGVGGQSAGLFPRDLGPGG